MLVPALVFKRSFDCSCVFQRSMLFFKQLLITSVKLHVTFTSQPYTRKYCYTTYEYRSVTLWHALISSSASLCWDIRNRDNLNTGQSQQGHSELKIVYAGTFRTLETLRREILNTRKSKQGHLE